MRFSVAKLAGEEVGAATAVAANGPARYLSTLTKLRSLCAIPSPSFPTPAAPASVDFDVGAQP